MSIKLLRSFHPAKLSVASLTCLLSILPGQQLHALPSAQNLVSQTSVVPTGQIPVSPQPNSVAKPQAPTANFVPQNVLDAANRIPVSTGLPLPGLGYADRFLPAPDLLANTRLLIKLGERRVYVYQKNQVLTSFPVAIGRDGWETPVGSHQVIQMVHNPVWEHPFTGELVPPGADNPLGARWIGFWTDGTNYIGFHGTPNEDSVGQSVSHGCVRMYNQDVIKLFQMVKIGTPVQVMP
jgi:L,D-transpeptidase ErfK/SrfK